MLSWNMTTFANGHKYQIVRCLDDAVWMQKKLKKE
jgi:hypothetical protein